MAGLTLRETPNLGDGPEWLATTSRPDLIRRERESGIILQRDNSGWSRQKRTYNDRICGRWLFSSAPLL